MSSIVLIVVNRQVELMGRKDCKQQLIWVMNNYGELWQFNCSK